MTNARDLSTRLADLLAREHGAMADFLVALADFDRQRLWLDLGYASVFHFLHRELGLSKGAAHYRKVAANLLQAFPEIEAPLRDGRLCITSIVELAKLLTPENRQEVLPRFFRCSRRDAAAVAAEIRPAEVVPQRTIVATVRAPSSVPAELNVQDLRQTLGERTQDSVQPVELDAAASPRPELQLSAPERRDEAVPLTSDLSRLHVTVSRQFLTKMVEPTAGGPEVLVPG